MDQLKQNLMSRVGLSEEQADQAMAIFAEFLKNNVSDEQLQSIAQKVPGLGQYADKLPGGLGEKLGGFLG